MLRILQRFSALATLLLCVSLNATEVVLFIGNSYTYGSGGTHSVPDIFDALANAAGEEDPTTVMRAVGGMDYKFHYEDSQSQIAAQVWTHVILQNRSTEPTHVGDIAAHLEYGERLYDSIIANDADTQVMLYQTWARQESHSLISGTSTDTTFASTDEMLEELVTNYTALAERINLNNPQKPAILINPVGKAFKAAGGNLPSSDPDYLDLYSDGTHANDLGYYLSACVHYSCIYQTSPEGLFETTAISDLGLSVTSPQAAFLEQVAWNTVSPPEEADTDAPELEQVSLTSSKTIDLFFNEALTAEAALEPSNYTLVNRGQRIVIESVDLSSSSQSVRLHLASDIIGNYALIPSARLIDIAGNPVSENSVHLGNRRSNTILIDFGGTYTVSGSTDTWNQAPAIDSTIRAQVDGGTPYVYHADLLDSNNLSTGISLSMTDNMLSTNSAGTDSGPYPSGATRDSFFGLTGTFGGYTEDGQGVFEFNQCDPEKAYTFRIFTSRIGDSENRETRYTLSGTNSLTGDLAISQNTSNNLELADIRPTAGGKVTLTISAGPNNDHDDQFYYLGLIEILTDDEPPETLYPPVPTSAGMFLDWTMDAELEYRNDLLLLDWIPVSPSPTPPYFDSENVPQRFYRVNDAP